MSRHARAGAFLAVALAAGVARADGRERLSLRGELGLGSMASRFQRAELDCGFGMQSTPRAGLAFSPCLAAQVSAAHWSFPRPDRGWGRATQLAAGLRADPPLPPLSRLLGRTIRPWVDGNAGVALTGPHDRAMFDLGAGVEIDALAGLALGPTFRWAQIVAAPTDAPENAEFWTVGVTITWRARRAP